MELTDYIRIFRQRGWIVILVGIIAAASAYGFSKMQTPVYSASTRVIVQPARADWGLSNVLKDLLRGYTEMIKTHDVAQEVIDRAQLDMQTVDLLGKLYLNTDSSNFTIQIEARDTSPEVAYAIVDTVAQVFIEDRNAWNQKQDRRDQIDVDMLDSVYSLGYQQHSPKTQINTLAGGIFGLMVGILVIFFLEWLTYDIMRTSDDVERALEVLVIGQIPAHNGHQGGEIQSVREQPKLVPELGAQ
ncbi:MAG: Wzz/FepE/Etk N-terminal domain-containing protein [Chloroflexota bacterium]